METLEQIDSRRFLLMVGRIKVFRQNKTSMMWPSQNFLLYNGAIIKIKGNEWINN